MNKKIINIDNKLSKYELLTLVFGIFVFLFLFLFWQFHPFGILCYSMIIISYIYVFYGRFATIKSFEISKEKIEIQKKDETITIKQDDIVAFKLIPKKMGFDIKVDTNNGEIFIPLNYSDAVYLNRFIIENSAFIENFLLEGDCHSFNIMEFNKKFYSLNIYMQYFIQILVLAVSISIMIVLIGNSMGGYHDVDVALIQNPQTANNVQTLLTTETTPTIRSKYGSLTSIAVRAKEDSDVYVAMAMIADSDYFDNGISIGVNHYKKKNKKYINEELTKRLLFIPGVMTAKVDLDIDNCDTDCPKANIEIKTVKDMEEQVRKAVINMMVRSDFVLEENIYIKFTYPNDELKAKQSKLWRYRATLDRIEKCYYDRATEAYIEAKNSNQDYTEAINILEQLNKRIPAYSRDIETLKQLQVLDNKIKKGPNNYKLYIERGDLRNVERYAMFKPKSDFVADIKGAIEDYNKALELNPKAYEVYEKRGDAWALIDHKIHGYKQSRYPEDDQHVIDDYTKAIELTGGNDRLYEKLGDRLRYNSPQEAIKYYSKITEPYKLPYERSQYLKEPYLTHPELFTWYHWGLAPIKIADCYSRLGELDKAIEITNDIMQNTNDKEYLQEANNMNFLYNWKAGHYKTALKNADNCSVWVCKLVGIFF